MGGLGAVLGRSWVVLGRHGSFRVILEPTSCRDPRLLATQRGAKMEPKSKTKTKSKKDALEDRLGAVLGRCWVVLGAVLRSSWGRRMGFRLGETAFREKLRF